MTKEQKELLRSIAAEQGDQIAAREFVARAKPKASILHDLIDWDDKRCADRDRINQAREILRSIKITIIHEERQIEVPGYVHDANADPGEQRYLPVDALREADDETKRRQLAIEVRMVLSYLERCRNLAAYLGMAPEVAEITERVRRLYRVPEART